MTRAYLDVPQACARYHWPTRKACYQWLSRLPASVRADLVSRRGRSLLFDADKLECFIRTGQVEQSVVRFRRSA